ncbi:MAG: trigger factor [Synergistaceae bacterium]|nr:trigger factor [Synergistaceae bacterium]
MRTELLGQEKNIVKVKIEIEASDFTKALNRTISELSQQGNFPGFRKGRVPRKIIEMRFGRDALYNEALEKIMNAELEQIVQDYELDLIDTPSLNVTEKIEEGKPVMCEMTFEVQPEVELPEIDGMEIEKVVTEVNDEAVDRLSKRIQIQLAEIKETDRPIQDGDLVDLELTIRAVNPDGSEEAEQPKPETTHEKINLADETVRAQVREALIGKSKGDEAEAVFDVEEGHADRSLAGKHVSYKMKIETVSEYILPEINEEFYKDVFGQDTDIKDEAAYRERLRQDIKGEVDQENQTDLYNRAVDLVASKAKLELPEKFIIRQIASMRAEDENWAKSNGIDLNTAFGIGTEEGRKGYEALLKNRAETAVRDVLVMDKLAEKYDIHVEQEDLEAEFDRKAEQLHVSKGFVAKYFHENKKQLERLTDQLKWDKTVEAMLTHMAVKEVKELSQQSQPEGQENQKNQESQENQGE